MKLVVNSSDISYWNNIYVFSDPTLGIAVTVAVVTKHWDAPAQYVSSTATDSTWLFPECLKDLHFDMRQNKFEKLISPHVPRKVLLTVPLTSSPKHMPEASSRLY